MRVINTRHQKTTKTILPWTPPEGFDRLKTQWGPKRTVYSGPERPQTLAARQGTSLQAQKDEEEYDASSFVDATDFLNLQEDSAGAPVPLREVPWEVPADIDDDFDDDALKAREAKRASLWAAHEKRFKQKFPCARDD